MNTTNNQMVLVQDIVAMAINFRGVALSAVHLPAGLVCKNGKVCENVRGNTVFRWKLADGRTVENSLNDIHNVPFMVGQI